jgi:uncharacterized membrane protein YbhN (UPF0104 family)
MRIGLPRWLSGHSLHRGGFLLAVVFAAAVLLEFAAGIGLAYVDGFSSVREALSDIDWAWLAALLAALAVSFAGYWYAYRGILRVGGGPELPGPQMHALVAAGFGGLLSHGGGVLERRALLAAGASESDARARVAALAGMEQGVLALAGCAAAIAVLAYGLSRPPLNTSLPWAVIPVPGLLIAFWAAERYRDSFRGRAGWRSYLTTFLESVHLIRELFIRPRRWWSAVAGMTVFWAGDAFAVWAGLAAFGFRMNGFALVVGFATGMVFTRRTGPLAGAGVLALVLPVTISYCGAGLAGAIVGVFAYRLAALWLPLPVSLAVVPTLRALAEQRVEQASRGTGEQPGAVGGQPGEQSADAAATTRQDARQKARAVDGPASGWRPGRRRGVGAAARRAGRHRSSSTPRPPHISGS